MAALDDPYYDGSRLFSLITEYTGIPIDQINFVVTQLVALGIAPVLRSAFHPSKTKPEVRHALGLITGLCIGYFAFGMQAVHLAGLPALCYIIIRTQDPQIMQRMVLAVSIFYLSCIHLHRQVYDYGSFTLDVTGPLMVITQKVTSLAYSLHDGLTHSEDELSPKRGYYAIRKVPTVLEYFAYVFQFQVLMAGPVIFYRDYIEFIHGHNFIKYTTSTDSLVDSNSNSHKVVLEPSASIVVLKKVACSALCALFFVTFISSFPIQRIQDDDFVEGKNVASQLVYLSVATVLVRFKYYHAWLLSDAICNLSGLGFNGYAVDGSAKWDLVSNVDIIKFEFGSSLRESIEHWNKGTNVWLRMLVYDRVPKYGTLLTYALSAFWHGFYPGYYLTFASGALFTFASRSVRRSLRPYFQTTPTMKTFYNLLTMLTTRVVMTYITFSFVLLEFWPSFRLYMHMYFGLHLAALAAIFILPRVLPIPPEQHTPLKDQLTRLASNGVTSGIHG